MIISVRQNTYGARKSKAWRMTAKFLCGVLLPWCHKKMSLLYGKCTHKHQKCLYCISLFRICYHNQRIFVQEKVIGLAYFYTVDCLIFVGYQFSWFSWWVWSTNFSAHKLATFCMNYEEKYYSHEFWTHECVIFVQPMKIGTHENKAINSIFLCAWL